MITQQAFLAIAGNALRVGGMETTLAELVAAADANARPLAAIPEVIETLASFGLTLSPSIEAGDLATVRILRRMPLAVEDEVDLAREMEQGEGQRVEYKESLCHNHGRARAQPDCPVNELRSDALVETALKSICGFLNSEGGVLLIGIADNGSVTGVEADFPHTGQATDLRNSLDKWQLFLRSAIHDRFHEGESINTYIYINFFTVNERKVARVVVQPRSRLSSVKHGALGYCAFLRRGNRTDRLEPWEIEEMLLSRRAPG